MSDLAKTDTLFFDRAGLDQSRIQHIVDDTLANADDGELYLEYCQSESVAFDDGRIRNASFDTMQGFGLRAVADEATGYAHSAELSETALKRASDAVRAVQSGHTGTMAGEPAATNQSL